MPLCWPGRSPAFAGEPVPARAMSVRPVKLTGRAGMLVTGGHTDVLNRQALPLVLAVLYFRPPRQQAPAVDCRLPAI